eukprot:g2808.t1
MYKFVLLNAGLALAALSGANGIVVNSNPRESSVQVGGISHLARMTDKAQLATEGKLPGDLQFPCPNDQKLLYKLGVQPTNFQEVVSRSKSDEDVLQFLKATSGETKVNSLRTDVMRFKRLGDNHHEHNYKWNGYVKDGVKGC